MEKIGIDHPFQSSGNDFKIQEGSLSKAASLKGRRLLIMDENRATLTVLLSLLMKLLSHKLYYSRLPRDADGFYVVVLTPKASPCSVQTSSVRPGTLLQGRFARFWLQDSTRSLTSRPDSLRTEPVEQKIPPRDEASQQRFAIEVPSSTSAAPAALLSRKFSTYNYSRTGTGSKTTETSRQWPSSSFRSRPRGFLLCFKEIIQAVPQLRTEKNMRKSRKK
ncbi:hypothetical protein SELMODRAFT_427374 [Selaginella moellendorffii]|uniref:Uncharacterized protein n=1 Tax=Selaginella moellendorffii TaxID=88036 RepID=D8SZD5_SELML|nr:hypothetical protein SELMODRAFT_427374 [Selaginella moellendorffii]